MENRTFDLVFVTTHINNEKIEKLLDSVVLNNSHLFIMFVVVSQDVQLSYFNKNRLVDLHIIKERKSSLSKARNIGLAYLEKHKVIAEHIMFPDDDTTYDLCFFRDYRSVVRKDKNYLLPIFIENSNRLYKGRLYIEGAKVPLMMTSLVGSPNQLIAYLNNSEKIRFNEELGVGCKYGSCEDYDLFLRLSKSDMPYYYSSKIYNFHPAKTVAIENMSFEGIKDRFKKYSSGFCYIILKYGHYSQIPSFLIRPLAAAMIYAFKLNTKLSVAYIYQFFERIRQLIFMKV